MDAEGTGEMAFSRAAGILLHPTSLPGRWGIGTIGAQAYRFVDTLQAAGMGLWQVLPLGPTGYGDSPYSALSAFAGNPFLIALDPLLERGWLKDEDLAVLSDLPETHVDFGRVVPGKMQVLRRAFDRYRESGSGGHEMEAFVRDNASWLEDFCLFMALKDWHGGASWVDWEPACRVREPGAIDVARSELGDAIQFHRFVQMLFFEQWQALKAYANDRGVRIVGDIPIFVANDSSDVWGNQRLFQLDENGIQTVDAGVPPDYFSVTGQLWGNPHYRWDVMRSEGFAWWIERFRRLLTMVDMVRLDHFRGFAAAWAVPHGNTTAEVGKWVPAPGMALFGALRDALGDVPIIAENLGVITSDVEAMRHTYGYPGMHILQFAFGSDANDPSLPHNIESNSVVYTGTHDNDTTIGWYEKATPQERASVRRYLGTPGYDVSWDLMRAAFASVALLAVVPLQDVLRLGGAARMNMPGRASGNWTWRFTDGAISDLHVGSLREIAETYGRARPAEQSLHGVDAGALESSLPH
jgi:4-alpha-glucanotransferase